MRNSVPEEAANGETRDLARNPHDLLLVARAWKLGVSELYVRADSCAF